MTDPTAKRLPPPFNDQTSYVVQGTMLNRLWNATAYMPVEDAEKVQTILLALGAWIEEAPGD